MQAIESLEHAIDEDTQKLLEQAAAIQGKSVAEFVIKSAVKQARRVLKRERTTYLSERDWKRVMELFDSNPKPNQKLKDAMHKYNTIFGGREIE